ncbi:hypothetical protein N7488_002701 [Penicillium malachiteum]|nr:hypothetical protein N7488_002701 [Penicillium malachiteum]
MAGSSERLGAKSKGKGLVAGSGVHTKVKKSKTQTKSKSKSKDKKKPDVKPSTQKIIDQIEAESSDSDDDVEEIQLGGPDMPDWAKDLLDESDDYDTQIARCQQRIEEGIQPHLFKDQLKVLEACKRKKNALLTKFPNLSYEVASRIQFFQRLQDFLFRDPDGDVCDVLPNVQSIVAAYASGKLKWVPGYVTYWSYGEQLTDLRKFSWEEFLNWNFKYNGSKGFWVEGVCTRSTVDTSRPIREDRAQYSLVPLNPVAVDTYLAGEHRQQPDEPIQGIQHTNWFYDTRDGYPSLIFWLIDDTGADICTISDGDVDHLREQTGLNNNPPLLGYAEVAGATGQPPVFEQIRALEINLWGQDPRTQSQGAMMLPHWDIIEVAIARNPADPSNEPTRILGPWLRHRFFTGTAPDGSGRLYILKKRRRFFEMPQTTIGDSGLLPGSVIQAAGP